MAPEPCGICFQSNQTLISVNLECEDNLTVLEKLLKVAPFQDWMDCKWICQNCKNLLDASYFFIDLCCKYKENQRRFTSKEKTNTYVNSRNSDNDTSEEECIEGEYVEIDDILGRDEVQLETEEIIIKIEPEIDALSPFTSTSKNVGTDKVKGEFYCALCEKTFASLISLEMHFKYSDHRNKCRICPEVFTDPAHLDSHVTNRHPGLANKFSCEVCDKEFLLEKEIIEHCMIEHNMEKNSVKPYSCNICNKRLARSSNFKRHLMYHEGIRHFTCTFCGKGFVIKKDLGEHERIHLNERKYRCDKCGKCFNTNANLRTHNIASHTDPSKWRHQCDLCPKRFAMSSSLLEHIKRHKGIKDHQCVVCESWFTTKYDMDRHMYYHTKDRPHKCRWCPNKSYRDRKGLKYHMLKVHEVAMQTED